jgi:transposase
MNEKPYLPLPEPIKQLQEQLNQFRRTHARRTKLPEPLWEAAVALARHHGIYAVAHPFAAGLRGSQEKTRWHLSYCTECGQGVQLEDGVRGVTRAKRDVDRGRHAGVRVSARQQNAHSTESDRKSRLDEAVAGLARNRRMIQISAQMRVLVAVEPVDGRKGIDSLVRLCQDKLSEDPRGIGADSASAGSGIVPRSRRSIRRSTGGFSGCVFIFRSRRGSSIRLLAYDGQGYWLAQKRLSKGRFVWWPEADTPTKGLEAYEAQLLMAAGDVSRVRAAPMWRRLHAK